MVKQNPGLSHHENIRLDYLHKSYHHLTPKEQKEFRYLQDKVNASLNDSIQFFHEEPEGYHKEEEEESLLPPYPKRSRATKKKQKSRKEQKKNTKKKLFKKKQLLKNVLRVAIISVAGIIGFTGYNYVKGWQSVVERPQVQTFNGEKAQDGINILLLGTDARPGQLGAESRADTIMVLNINNSDNKLKLASFMRDTLIDFDGYEYKINAAYAFGEEDGGQGAEYTRQVLSENFGLEISHYAIINFATFAEGIDTLFPEGVFIDAQFSTIDGEQVNYVDAPNDLMIDGENDPYQRIKVGPQYMDGRTLLNYARFRSDDEGDFGRTRRQQEVLAAVIKQAKNPLKIFNSAEALGKIHAMTPTTMSTPFLLSNSYSVLSDAMNGVEHVTIPEYGDWVDVYDSNGGMALQINFLKYQSKLAELGME